MVQFANMQFDSWLGASATSIFVSQEHVIPIYQPNLYAYCGLLSWCTVLVRGWQQHVSNKGCNHPDYHKLPMFKQHVEERV